MKLRQWLITKLAGDTLVVLNAVVFYKYYPAFADPENKPIIDNCTFMQTESETPFHIYSSNMFDLTGKELNLKEKYMEAYDEVITDIKDQLAKLSEEKKEEPKTDE